ncbi:hypothetical protein ACQBAU_17710 [Propionibacteriaceae bacterium Y2011]
MFVTVTSPATVPVFTITPVLKIVPSPAMDAALRMVPELVIEPP